MVPAFADVAAPSGAGVGEFHRRLDTLPKAHLHIHLPAALRRSAFCAAVQEHLLTEPTKSRLLTELNEKEAEAARAVKETAAAKYRRRAAWLRAGCPYPASLDTSDVRRFDATAEDTFTTDASLAWDVQWAAKTLLEAVSPEVTRALTFQTLQHLVEDAEAEAVEHIELMTGVEYDPRDLSRSDEAVQTKWGMLFAARRSALSAPEPISLKFVVSIPRACRSVEDASRLLTALGNTEGFEPDVIAGFGFYGGEANILAHQDAFGFLKGEGWPLVCVHAGEGEPSRGKGVQRVQDAISVGASRVGHGIEAAASAETMELLRQGGVCLEVCPLSNRALGCCLAVDSQLLPLLRTEAMAATNQVEDAEGDATGNAEAGTGGDAASALAASCASVEQASTHLGSSRNQRWSGLALHPLPRLLAAGVSCALAADDPLLWSGEEDPANGLVREFWVARNMMGLDDATLARLAAASFEHSYAPVSAKNHALERVKTWLDDFHTFSVDHRAHAK